MKYINAKDAQLGMRRSATNMTTTQKEIERLVNERPMKDSKDLFRAKLEYLVLIAQREQLIAD